MTDWSEEQPTIELLKQTVTVPEVAEMLGLEPDSNGKITSPWNPDERTPSCHLYEDHFYDFSTGKGGDVIDLVRAFDPKMTVKRALKTIWNRALRAGREPGDVERQPVRQIVDFTEEINNLSCWVGQLDDGTPVPGFCRVLDGNLLIPHEDQEGVYGVKVRAPDGTKSSWPGSQFTKRLYDPLGWRDTDRDPGSVCVIAEGESDCWALQAVLPFDEVFALPSGASAWKDAWLTDLEPFEKVYICTDNDRAGNEARSKLLAKIHKGVSLMVPQLYNDAREAIAAGWRPTL